MMDKYKYYQKSDKKKESVGTVKAYGLEDAVRKAAIKKHLKMDTFKKLFNIEKMKYEGKNKK
tara:strand:+ start:146 stop:331 length:186 start_codon:yes stop_codon:yes gene_type:complete